MLCLSAPKLLLEMKIEEKKELEAKKTESLVTLNSLVIDVPPFAVSSEDFVFNQFKLVDVV